MDDLKQDTLDTKAVPAEAWSAAGLAAPTGSADPAIICSQCRKQITAGSVLVIGDDIMGSPFFCSMQCVNDYKPDTLTIAKLESIFGRWRRTQQPNNAISQPSALKPLNNK